MAEVIDARRLIFVDECGTHTSLAPIYGWARKGERLSKKVPRNRGKNTTLLVSITYGGMGRCLAVEGATTNAVFEAYLERVLGPALSPEQVVVMDNLAAHKGERVRGPRREGAGLDDRDLFGRRRTRRQARARDRAAPRVGGEAGLNSSTCGSPWSPGESPRL